MKLDYAYCAGLVDGEGCIQINKNDSTKLYRQNRSPQYQLKIQVNMTSIDCIKKLQGVFGGKFYSRDREGTRFQSYNWWIGSNQCAKAIKKMLPYLHEKKLQALLAIEFQNMLNRRVKIQRRLGRSRIRLSEQELTKREYYFTRLKELKTENLTLVASKGLP